MVMTPLASPNHIKNIEDSKIKPKSFRTSDIGRGFYFNKTPLTTPDKKVDKLGQNNIGTYIG